MSSEAIIQSVLQAVTLCREVQHRFLYSSEKFSGDKGETEPVTIADYGSQAIICRTIAKHFPDDAILAEEQSSQFLELVDTEGRAQILKLLTTILDEPVTQQDVMRWLDHGKGRQSARVWVIDPIDGTKGFLAMRHYAVGVGLIEYGRPVEGIIACPGYGDGVSGRDEGGALFFTRGGKAYQQPLHSSEPVMIQASRRTQPDTMHSVESVEKEHSSKDRMSAVRERVGMSAANVREIDSMEKYALVANGDADLFLRLPDVENIRPHMVWDHAPGAALVEAAGGRVTDIDGTPLDFSRGRVLPKRGIIVSSGQIHDRIVKAAMEVVAG